MDGLMLHCGGHAATLEEIARVPTPEPTATHYPIPHGKLIQQVRSQLLDAGVQIREEAYGLSHEGARVFGVLALRAEHLPTIAGSNLVLGLRNRHDCSVCAGLALGNVVLVCDNMSFLGTRTLARKHTRFVERGLPALIARILGSLGEWSTRQAELIETYAATPLNDELAHDNPGISKLLPPENCSRPHFSDDGVEVPLSRIVESYPNNLFWHGHNRYLRQILLHSFIFYDYTATDSSA